MKTLLTIGGYVVAEEVKVTNMPNGMPFVNWLTLLFIALRLTDYIDWSWYYIGMPFFFGVFIKSLENYISIKNKGKI